MMARPNGKPRTTLGVRLDPQTHLAIKAVASLEGISPSEVARQALANVFDGLIDDALLGKEFEARTAQIKEGIAVETAEQPV